MSKVFVLDTNVILLDPLAIHKFGKNTVYMPLIVVEEVDRFKKDQNENGRNARQFSRLIDDLRKKGSLSDGVKLDNGGTLIIAANKLLDKNIVKNIDVSIPDNLILATAMDLKKSHKSVLLVTKDINLRLKADVLGVEADDYGAQDVTLDELYSGQLIEDISASEFESFQSERFLDESVLSISPVPNQYLVFHEDGNPQKRLLGRYCQKKRGVVPLINNREGVWGIYPKNMEQQFALDALLNDEIKLVTLVGKAGTGKTLLAIAAGLEKTIGLQKYNRLLVSRPIQPMGKDLGFLPGDINEKLIPWMQPIFDNIDFLFGNKNKNESSWEELINEGLLYIEPLTYIRGRSIPEQFMIVDEAQNLSPHEVKTIVTRAAEGTKIVLTGDCEQIDSPYLDSVNNGLAYCLDRLKSLDIVAHSSLNVGERSALSEAASKLL